ncbi:MAG: radical SAM protein [Methylacidiphilales bacterium]|nr:radical SAM protein [Candidatus Methylacidiphilales bacterium]
MKALIEKPIKDLSKRPHLIIWEATRACALDCRHCRARLERTDPSLELDTLEAEHLIEEVRRAAPDIFIITGGDPMLREDIFPLLHRARWAGVPVALNPSVTPQLLKTDFRALAQAGVRRLSLSLDGATPESHDSFRGVPGSWHRTVTAISMAHEAKLPIQINTILTRRNLEEFDRLPGLIESIRPAAWTIFLLVPVKRGQIDDMPTAAEVETVFQRLYEVSQSARYKLSTTEGMHYRRIAWQRGKRSESARTLPPGTGDGRGIVFITSTGEICPSAFMREIAGDIRTDNLLEVYREHPVFRHLRNPNALRGKCGWCQYRIACGGSRSRAYAATGDPFESDPLCAYEPVTEIELVG